MLEGQSIPAKLTQAPFKILRYYGFIKDNINSNVLLFLLKIK